MSFFTKFKSNMKNQLKLIAAFFTGVCLFLNACQPSTSDSNTAAGAVTEAAQGTDAGNSQATVKDETSEQNIVKVAVGSKDHTTLVAALQAAELVDDLANVGPFTVFAPTNAAFDALPAGTVEGLLKPDKKADLANILQYHVTTSALTEFMLRDGMKLGMVNGGSVTVKIADGKTMINDATVLGTVKATNGMVYVIDKVLLPK